MLAVLSTAASLAASGGPLRPRNPCQPGTLGILREDSYAGLILVDGNPLENLQLVADRDENFDLIMKDGNVYSNTLQ